MIQPLRLNFVKCWQGQENFLVWQVSHRLKKKSYFVARAERQNVSLDFQPSKPEGLKPQAALINLIRKYAPKSRVMHVLSQPQSSDIWICLHTDDFENPSFFIHLCASVPAEIRFLDLKGTIHVKSSHKATFTKRSQYEGPLPDTSWSNLLPSLWENFLAQENAAQPEETQVEPPADLGSVQREALKRCRRRLKTLKKSRLKQQQRLPTKKAIENCKLRARLLQTYGYLVKDQMLELKLEPALTGLPESIGIPLDPDIPVGQQKDRFFSQAKKLEKSRHHGERQLAKLDAAILQSEHDIQQLASQTLTASAINELLATFQLAGKQDPSSQTTKLKKLPYTEYQGTHCKFWVGKSAKDNDTLTKLAKANDYWIHVVGLPGSHVIIPKKSLTSEALSPQICRQAAILAIHFSKIRADFAGEVYVTQKQHVKKKRGLAPGAWLVEKSDTLFVRYDAEELKSLLDLQSRDS